MALARTYLSQSAFFDSGVLGHLLKPGEVYQVIIGNWFSPVEFHVVFAMFEEALRSLQDKLNEAYSGSVVPPDISEMGIGAPCCVRADGNWRRAKVLIPCGNQGVELHVRLVDSGESKFVRKEKVRGLEAKFADLPPLAVQCEMLGINRNCLCRDVLDRFRRNCRQKKAFNLTFVPGFEEKLFVRLFDMDMNDLFRVHFGEMMIRAEQAERQRTAARLEKERMNSKRAKMESEKTPQIVCDIDDLLLEDF